MKKPITNSHLKFNCPVNWDSMENTNGGKNCHQCQKKVFDLTNCSQDEMDMILIQNNHNICAMFNSQQMAPQKISLPLWKKWLSAAMLLIGFNLFTDKSAAQNPPSITEQNRQNSNSNPNVIGEVYIAPDQTIHAKPVMGEKAFNKIIKDLIGQKSGQLNTTITVDMSGAFKDIYIHDHSLKSLGIDPAIQQKIKETFKKAKWQPATRRGRIVNDPEFVYIVLLETN